MKSILEKQLEESRKIHPSSLPPINITKLAHKPRQDKDHVVKVTIEIPTFGSDTQAIDTARRAVKDMAVRFSTTLSGRYVKGKTIYVFTYDRSGKALDDPDFEGYKQLPYENK